MLRIQPGTVCMQSKIALSCGSCPKHPLLHTMAVMADLCDAADVLIWLRASPLLFPVSSALTIPSTGNYLCTIQRLNGEEKKQVVSSYVSHNRGTHQIVVSKARVIWCRLLQWNYKNTTPQAFPSQPERGFHIWMSWILMRVLLYVILAPIIRKHPAFPKFWGTEHWLPSQAD